MGYRPITDVWILARSKVKFFGAYPAGFLSRARDLLSVTNDDQVLHVCSGRVLDYPYEGFGINDLTMDLDSNLRPDIIGDAAQEATYRSAITDHPQIQAVLSDPPYTLEFAARYAPGASRFVTSDQIVRNSIAILPELLSATEISGAGTPFTRKLTMLDLFGQEVTEQTKKSGQANGYSARPGTGPEGETCKTCHHCVHMRWSAKKTFHKDGDKLPLDAWDHTE